MQKGSVTHGRRGRSRAITAAALGVLLCHCGWLSQTAQGATESWNPLDSNSGASDGTGNWDALTTTTDWSYPNTFWTNGNVAAFGAGTGGSGSENVTVDGAVTASGITFNASSPTYTIGGSSVLTMTTGAITLSQSGAISPPLSIASGQTVNVNGSITGSYTLTLSGNNTNSGTISVGGSTNYPILKLGSASALGSGTVAINSENPVGTGYFGALDLNGQSISNYTFIGGGNGSVLETSTGSATDSGNVRIPNSGFQYFAAAPSTMLTLSGIFSVGNDSGNSAGEIIIGNTGNSGVVALTGNNSFLSGGKIEVANGVLRADDGAGLSSNDVLWLNGGVLESRLDFSRALGTVSGDTYLGSGNGGASGFSAYDSGATPSSPGINVAVTGGSQWGSANFAPTTFVLNASTANEPLAFTSNIDLNGATRTIAVNATATNTAATFTGVLSNSSGTAAGLSKSGPGTLILSNVDTYNGPTTITGGTLSLSSSASIANTPTIDVQAGTTFGVSNVSGGFTVAGSQTLKGAGTVNGSLTISGTFSVGETNAATTGTASALAVSSNLTLGGTTQLDLFSATAYDSVSVGGTITYAGILQVNDESGGKLAAGETFHIFTGFSNESGSFGSIVSSNADSFSFNGSTGVLTVTAVPEPSSGTAITLGSLSLLVKRRRRAGGDRPR